MIKHTATLPCGYRVEFSWSTGNMTVAWVPDVPVIRSPRHRRKFFAKYVKARREFLELVALQLGGSVGVLDLSRDRAAFGVIEQPVRH